MKKLYSIVIAFMLVFAASVAPFSALADTKTVYFYENNGIRSEYTLESDTEVSCIVLENDEIISSGSGTYEKDDDTFIVTIAGLCTWFFVDESGELTKINAPQAEKSLSAEDVKEIINSVLSDKQKEQAEKTANIIAERFNVNATTVYIVLTLGLIIIFLVGFLVARIIVITKSKAKTSEKLLAIQATLSDKIAEIEQLHAALQSLDKDKISATFGDVVKPVVEEITPEIIKGVEDGLKLDGNVMQKVLGTTATTSEQISVIIEALKVLALKSNQTEMANVLTKSPTADAYAEVVMENEKLKTALGEKAVKKVVEK